MDFLSDIWSVIWWFFWAFAFIAYLMTLFSVVGDLFRDHTLSGWAKALWILFLLFVPFLTVLAYVIARGQGMAHRSASAAQKAQANAEEYIRDVAGTSPAGEIERAKALLDAGSITQGEFDALKAKALA